MFNKKPPQLLQYQKISFKSVLGANCTIHGQLNIGGNYHIVGQVLGDIVDVENSGAVLWIDKSAYVKGNILCSNLVLAGTLEGNISASVAVEVCSGASITGDIQSERLYVDSNARINGRLNCSNDNQLKEVLKKLSSGTDP